MAAAFACLPVGPACSTCPKNCAQELPWPVFVQGELPRTELLRLFKNTPHAVLFGTRSFWEGVDVPGDALSLVIIDKLPFPSPRDPLHEARTEQIQENGGNSFFEYTLPLMILTLKQGFGRLIRTKTDRGVVAILDNRLSTKRYGGTVIRSLPPARTSRRFGDVHRFFSTPPFEADYALTVWAEESDDDRAHAYRWRLTCLPDGRTREGNGHRNHRLRRALGGRVGRSPKPAGRDPKGRAQQRRF